MISGGKSKKRTDCASASRDRQMFLNFFRNIFVKNLKNISPSFWTISGGKGKKWTDCASGNWETDIAFHTKDGNHICCAAVMLHIQKDKYKYIDKDTFWDLSTYACKSMNFEYLCHIEFVDQLSQQQHLQLLPARHCTECTAAFFI